MEQEEEKNNDEVTKETRNNEQAEQIQEQLRKVMRMVDGVTNQTPSNGTISGTEDAEEYYPVERIIRGKYTPEGIKYLIKWENYSAKHNTWEKESDLAPDTLEYIRQHPVRIFGRKPTPVVNPEDNTMDIVHMTPDEIQEAYEADTVVDSSEEDNMSDVMGE